MRVPLSVATKGKTKTKTKQTRKAFCDPQVYIQGTDRRFRFKWKARGMNSSELFSSKVDSPCTYHVKCAPQEITSAPSCSPPFTEAYPYMGDRLVLGSLAVSRVQCYHRGSKFLHPNYRRQVGLV